LNEDNCPYSTPRSGLKNSFSRRIQITSTYRSGGKNGIVGSPKKIICSMLWEKKKKAMSVWHHDGSMTLGKLKDVIKT
jgi:hypothetical protein